MNASHCLDEVTTLDELDHWLNPVYVLHIVRAHICKDEWTRSAFTSSWTRSDEVGRGQVF